MSMPSLYTLPHCQFPMYHQYVVLLLLLLLVVVVVVSGVRQIFFENTFHLGTGVVFSEFMLYNLEMESDERVVDIKASQLDSTLWNVCMWSRVNTPIGLFCFVARRFCTAFGRGESGEGRGGDVPIFDILALKWTLWACCGKGVSAAKRDYGRQLMWGERRVSCSG